MSDDEQRRIFAANLTDLLEKKQKSQREVARVLGVTPQAVNSWCLGTSLPRMGKIQKLADYLRAPKSALIEPHSEVYYTDEGVAEIAQQIVDNPNMRALFDAARGCTPEDMQLITDMIERFKKTNPDG